MLIFQNICLFFSFYVCACNLIWDIWLLRFYSVISPNSSALPPSPAPFLPVSPYIDAHSYFMRWFHANKHTHTQSKTPQTFCQNDWSIYVVGIVAAGNRENVESNGGQQKQNHSKFNMHAECLYENVQNACKCGFAWVSPCTLLPSLHPPFIFLFFDRKRRRRPKHFVFIANCAFLNW